MGAATLIAQNETYTLQECIDIALQNNFDITSAKLRASTSEVNYKQNRNALLPTVNGSYNVGISRGRSIDPFTNDFVNEQLTFSNARLNLDAVVFNGFRLLNQWKQARLSLQASDMEVEEAKQNLVLDVTLGYLQVLNARDVARLAATRITSTEEQVRRLEVLFEAESGDPVNFRDLQGQIANDKAALIAAQNNVRSAELDFNLLLNSPTQITADQLALLVEMSPVTSTSDEIYQQALTHLPTFKARDLRVEAAKKGVGVAKAQYVPELRVFANVGTNYSSAARLFNETGTALQETGDFVTIENETFPVQTEQTLFTPEEITYGDQFDNNVNSSVGLAVNIPILNGARARNNVALEKIRAQEALVALERTQREIKQAISQTYNTLLAVQQRYDALTDQVAAYTESFRINTIRFENGVSTSVDYIASKNNLENAQVNLANATYEFQLRKKILDYYAGGLDID